MGNVQGWENSWTSLVEANHNSMMMLMKRLLDDK